MNKNIIKKIQKWNNRNLKNKNKNIIKIKSKINKTNYKIKNKPIKRKGEYGFNN